MTSVQLSEHPLASVAVYVYEPAASPLVAGPLIVTGAAPPLPLTDTEPSAPPLQLALFSTVQLIVTPVVG